LQTPPLLPVYSQQIVRHTQEKGKRNQAPNNVKLLHYHLMNDRTS